MVGSFGFLGNQTIGEKTIAEQVVENIRYWLDISFLEMGGYDNISLHEENNRSTDISELKKVEDRVYGDGYVYQSFFKNWVYESGANFPSAAVQPVICSGFWVDSDFHDKSSSGALAHHVDYIHGRIIFDDVDPVDTAYGSGDVQIYAEFSYKRVNIVAEHELHRTVAVSEEMNNPLGSGLDVMSDLQIALPAVIISQVRDEWTGFQLGGSKKANHTIIGRVYSPERYQASRIVDILSEQENKRIPSIDWNLTESPVDEYGDVNPLFSGVYIIQDLYPWKDLYLLNSVGVKRAGIIANGSVNFLVQSLPHT